MENEAGEVQVAVEATPSFWRAPLEFSVHAFVGTSIFGTIAAPEFILEAALKQLQIVHIDAVIMLGLRGAEYMLFITDLGLFVIFLWRAAKRAAKNL
jgi:hypothetical protein